MSIDSRHLNLDRLRVLAENALAHPTLLVSVSGAHLYGFASADSDVALRGAHLLPIPALLGLAPPKETVTRTWDDAGLEIDLVSHDLGKFIRLLLEQNGNYLEQLYSPLVVVDSPWAEELRELVKQGTIARHVYHAYAGYARGQWKMWREEAQSGAPRLKPLLYAYRVSLTGRHLLRTGEVNANLAELAPVYGYGHLLELIAAKQAEKETFPLPVEEHEQALAGLQDDLTDAFAASPLPEKPTNRAALNDFLVRTRLALSMERRE